MLAKVLDVADLQTGPRFELGNHAPGPVYRQPIAQRLLPACLGLGDPWGAHTNRRHRCLIHGATLCGPFSQD